MSATATPTDPYTVMSDIQRDAALLARKSQDHGEVIVKLSEVAGRWDRAIQTELVRIFHEFNGKPPAEDIRKAMAHDKVINGDPELWAEYTSLTAREHALRQFCNRRQSVLSANQSLLSALRAEARA
jgi:hypothetical protein